MNSKGTADEISRRLLEELSKESGITQRALAGRIGIALGLVNAYIKRLYKKGYIKVKNLPKNRIKYLITPKGFTEKARLTYSYMHRSINYFKEARQKIEQTYALMLASDVKDILLWGDGEIAELCSISTRGLPLKIVGVVANSGIENEFFGHHVYSIDDVKDINYDAVLITSIEDKIMETINLSGIQPDKIYYL